MYTFIINFLIKNLLTIIPNDSLGLLTSIIVLREFVIFAPLGTNINASKLGMFFIFFIKKTNEFFLFYQVKLIF